MLLLDIRLKTPPKNVCTRLDMESQANGAQARIQSTEKELLVALELLGKMCQQSNVLLPDTD